MNLLKEMWFSDPKPHGTEYLDESAGNLKGLPEPWLKWLTAGRFSSTGAPANAGENSEVVQVGTDIFKKGAKRGGDTHYSKPKEKGSLIDRMINANIDQFGGWSTGSKAGVAGVFIKVDGHPYALIYNNSPAVAEKASDRFKMVLYSGRQHTIMQTKSRTTTSGRGAHRRTRHHSWEVANQHHSMEEIGRQIPDGEVDMYFVTVDVFRIMKQDKRSAEKRGSWRRTNPQYSGKNAWEDPGLAAWKQSVDNKQGAVKIEQAAKIAKDLLNNEVKKLVSELEQNIDDAATGNMKDDRSFGNLSGLSDSIRNIQKIAQAINSVIKKGVYDTGWSGKKEKSWEYKRLLQLIDDMKK